MRFLKYIAVAILVPAALLGMWIGVLRLSGNVAEVEPGLVYRSGQLSPIQLANLIQARHLKTVINLRGEDTDAPWYQQELAVTRAADVHLVSIRMSAHDEPSQQTLEALVQTLGTAQQPLLVHCEGGADRTGLAMALYELIWKRRSASLAAGQLSLRFGHFPWMNATAAMDRTFWHVERQIAASGPPTLTAP